MATIPIDLKEGQIVKDEIIVGIDLGTTNSLVAYMENDRPLIIKNEAGSSGLVPSIVHFLENGEPIIGDRAKDHLIAHPERTIYSVKRLMGKSYLDVDDWSTFYSYAVVNDQHDDSLVKIKVADRYYNPVGLSSIILRELKARAELVLSKTVSKAVITVPAYFNDVQRQATRDAGKLAGLEVLRIVNEPTAASLAYGLDNAQKASTIAVFDLGGGTFDVSILTVQDGIFEVLSTHGDTFLGGDDFDKLIRNHWETQVNWETISSDDAGWKQAIRLEAEKAKMHLSSSLEYSGNVLGIPVKINRETFDALATQLVDRTISSCQQALQDAGLEVSDINHVVMVGGSTRIPLVQQRVSAFFGQEPNNKLNPDEVVAMGAAIQADILAGNRKDMLLLDVTPLSLGIETVGGLMDVIIPRNSKVPTKVGRQYTTSVDGQKNLKIAVYQGERDLVEDNRKLGEFTLRDIPPMPMGIPKIEIKFLLDADGILRVNARELRSDTEQELEINSAYSISEEEMALMLIDSLNNAQADIAEKAVRETINEANHLMKSTNRFLEQNEEILGDASKSKLKTLTELVKKSIDTRDKNKIQQAMDDLNEFATPLAHEALDRNVAQAMKNTSI